MRVDSHHHFWNYAPEEYGWITDDKAVLKRDFGAKDLLAVIEPAGIDGVVSVQARQTVEETKWLLEIAAENEFVKGVVGWVPLRDSDAQVAIEDWSHHDNLKAVRHVVHDEPDDDFILGKEFNAGISHLKNYGLVYDILIFAKHLPNTIEFVDQHPEQPFVVDHIAKPTIHADKFDEDWKKHFVELAKRPNVSCKFSGVVTEVRDETWDLDTIRPYWEVAVEAFGDKRLMYGSDWPVCLLKSEYARWVEAVKELAGQLSESEQVEFWGGTAARVYNLA